MNIDQNEVDTYISKLKFLVENHNPCTLDEYSTCEYIKMISRLLINLYVLE